MENNEHILRVIKISKNINADKLKDGFNEDKFMVFGISDVLETISYTGNIFENIPKAIEDNNETLNSQIFLLHTNQSDNLFWESAKKRKYFFISFIELKDETKINFFANKNLNIESLISCVNNSTEEIWSHISMIYEKYNQGNNESIHCYETFDDYDLVICISSNNYDDALNIMNQIYQEFKIMDIYTYFCSHFKHFLNVDSIDETEVIAKNASLKLDLKNTCVSDENTIQVINTQLKNLKVTITGQHYILGSNDVIYNIENLTDKQLFDLYNESSPISLIKRKEKKYINRSELKIFTEMKKEFSPSLYDSDINFNDAHDPLDKEKNICGWTVEKEKIYPEFKKIYDLFNKNYLTSKLDSFVYSIYHTLKYLWNKFNEKDDDFFESCNTLYSSLQDIYNISDSFRIRINNNNFFISNFDLTPPKLMIFYNALVYKIKYILLFNNQLADTKKHFSLLVRPIRGLNVMLSPIFSKVQDNSYNNRLLMVNIPFKYISSPRLTIPYLVHEEAHYIGDIVRDRDQRAILICNSIKTMIIGQFVNLLDNNCDIIEYLKENTVIDESKINYKFFENIFSNVFNEIFEKNIIDKGIKIKYWNELPDVLETTILNSIIEFKKRIMNKLNDFFLNNYSLESDDFYIMNSKINTVDEVLSEFIKYCREMDSFSNQIEKIFEMYSETYADIMSIKMLDLNYESYIKIATDSVKEQIIAKKYDKLDFVFLRIFICSHASKIMDKSQIKKDNSYEANVAINIEKYNESYMKYIELVNNQSEEAINIKWCSDYFEYPVMAADLIKYLKSCLKMFDEVLKDDKELSKFKEMYNIFSGNNNIGQLKVMDQLITEYKYKINIDIYNAHKN